MIRLAISVEGETEEAFVNKVLAEHLRTKGLETQPILLGGDITVPKLSSEMARLHWSFDRVTSLVDFYGFRDKGTSSPEQLEQVISREIDCRVGRSWDQTRVIPYIQQHEFEGLLFSDVNAFAETPDAPNDCVERLMLIRSQFQTPEDINDSIRTAPSKRIVDVIPRYRKVVHGILVAEAVGLEVIRCECPRFNSWLRHLESLEKC